MYEIWRRHRYSRLGEYTCPTLCCYSHLIEKTGKGVMKSGLSPVHLSSGSTITRVLHQKVARERHMSTLRLGTPIGVYEIFSCGNVRGGDKFFS